MATQIRGTTRGTMTRAEILELLWLKSWSQGALARALETEPSTVGRWIKGPTLPNGGTRILLRQWLDQARTENPALARQWRTENPHHKSLEESLAEENAGRSRSTKKKTA